MSTHDTQIGARGEKAAVRYLEQSGFTVLETNFAARAGDRLLGEVDIVAQYDNVVHMCEVKTASRRYRGDVDPVDRINRKKLQHLMRAGEMWVNGAGHTGNWQVDVIVVHLRGNRDAAYIRHVQDVAGDIY